MINMIVICVGSLIIGVACGAAGMTWRDIPFNIIVATYVTVTTLIQVRV